MQVENGGKFIKSEKYINEIIDMKLIKNNEFNIIASGCGSGKTHFVGNELINYYNEISTNEILLLTSRSMIVEQQSKSKNINKFNKKDKELLKYWNDEIDENEYLMSKGIQIMTYDKIINILISENNENTETLKRIKVVVIDECHTLFSDGFIQNIEALKVWIRDSIYKNDKIFLGLTATPNILNYYQNQWGVKINQLNKDILIKYTAKQLHCTNFETLPYIIATNRLKGKSIIMCNSISDCIKLQDKLPNAALLVSKNNEYYKHDKSMKEIRDTIINKSILPTKFMYPIKRDSRGYGLEFDERNLEILITTSTLREGVNIKEESGIRNVICCYQDELHISQFMGRCRYDIDNLVVVDTYVRSDNYNTADYLSQCHTKFKSFIADKSEAEWFDSISHLIDHDCYDTKRYMLGTDTKKFIDYINDNWLVPIGVNEKSIDNYKIWKSEDKENIIEMAISCKLYSLYKTKITFNKVINTLVETLGYEIESGRQMINKTQHTYKLIISFDEDKITFIKPYKGINET